MTETAPPQFLTEPDPARGIAQEVAPDVRRIVADNPGPMTYHGTNTYLIDADEGVTVLDPGPDSAPHVAAILNATAGRIARILVSHTHRDHYGAVAALQGATGAPVSAFRRSADPAFSADTALDDGDEIGGLVAIHTPGHAADHLCFARRDGVLFTADHVMSWSTSVVNPPGGDMAAYCASLRLLVTRDDRLYLSGHGPPLAEPPAFVRKLLGHRIARENAILSALADRPADTSALAERIYRNVDPRLRRAAERNLLAHLLKLEAERRACRNGEVWSAK